MSHDFKELLEEAKRSLKYIEYKSILSKKPLSEWYSYHSLKSKVVLYERRLKLSKIK